MNGGLPPGARVTSVRELAAYIDHFIDERHMLPRDAVLAAVRALDLHFLPEQVEKIVWAIEQDRERRAMARDDHMVVLSNGLPVQTIHRDDYAEMTAPSMDVVGVDAKRKQ